MLTHTIYVEKKREKMNCPKVGQWLHELLRCVPTIKLSLIYFCVGKDLEIEFVFIAISDVFWRRFFFSFNTSQQLMNQTDKLKCGRWSNIHSFNQNNHHNENETKNKQVNGSTRQNWIISQLKVTNSSSATLEYWFVSSLTFFHRTQTV